jgi:hypothetical protein
MNALDQTSASRADFLFARSRLTALCAISLHLLSFDVRALRLPLAFGARVLLAPLAFVVPVRLPFSPCLFSSLLVLLSLSLGCLPRALSVFLDERSPKSPTSRGLQPLQLLLSMDISFLRGEFE